MFEKIIEILDLELVDTLKLTIFCCFSAFLAFVVVEHGIYRGWGEQYDGHVKLSLILPVVS